MQNNKELLERVVRIQYMIGEADKKPRKFGTDELMYQSEIHFIDSIGQSEGVSAYEMADRLKITNGAVTQISDKLIKKGMIDKYKKMDNKKAVFYRLTNKGKVAFSSHKDFHSILSDRIIEYLSTLTKDQYERLIGLLEVIEKYLPSNSNLDKE